MFAYIDIGTGSYLFQIAIGGALAGIFLLKHAFQRLTRRRGKQPDPRQDRDPGAGNAHVSADEQAR